MSRNVPGPIWHPGPGSRAEYNVPCYNAGPGPNAANRNLWSAQHYPRPRLVLEEIRQTKLITIKLPCLGRFQG